MVYVRSGDERDVNVHRLVSFSPCLLIHKTGANALDLDSRLRLLLNVLDENTLQHVRQRGPKCAGGPSHSLMVQQPWP